MNKQIEQVETIMTEYAERESVSAKRKKTKLGRGFKQSFFSSDARQNGNLDYTINEEGLILSNF